MAAFLNEHGIAAIGLRYHLNKAPMPQGMKMPPMVDVTHPEQFPKADANPMHTASGDSIISLAAMDAMVALHTVRDHAEEGYIDKNKVGFLGFSAGGGVAIAATMAAMVAGGRDEFPDFICTTPFCRGIQIAVDHILSHPELQKPDPEFDDFSDRLITAMDHVKLSL